MGWNELFTRARRQHGALRISDAHVDGVSPSTLDKKARRESWARPVRNVVVVPGNPPSHEQRAAIQVLAMGGDAAATRRTAAYLYGLVDSAPAQADVVVSNGRKAPKRLAVKALRSRTLEDADRTEMRGIPCVTVERMLLDLAKVCTRAELRRIVVDALQRRLLTLDRVIERMSRVGVLHGRRKLRRICYELDAERCDSLLERHVRRWLREQGFPTPDRAPAALPIRGITLHVDIAWSMLRIGIEVRGFGAHSSRDQLTKDGRRLNRLAMAQDWIVLHVDWDRLEGDPDGFLAELRWAFDAAAARLATG